MTPEEVQALREKEIAQLRTLRSTLVPDLFDERQRRGAAARLRRVDARIQRLTGPSDEDEDEGDTLLETLIGPGKPGRTTDG